MHQRVAAALSAGGRRAKEVAGLNYGKTYLSHVVTKLAKRRQKKDLQKCAFSALGPAATAPDAIFALSYKMTRQEIRVR